MPKNSLFSMNDNGQPSWGDQDDHDDDITSLLDDDIISLDDDYLNSFNNDSDHVITTNCVYSQQEIDYLETHVKNFVEEQRIKVLDTIQKGIIKDRQWKIINHLKPQIMQVKVYQKGLHIPTRNF